MEQRYMTAAQYAQHIAVSEATLRRYIRAGIIPTYHVGSRRTILVAEADGHYDRFVREQHEQQHPPDPEELAALEELQRALDELDDI